MFKEDVTRNKSNHIWTNEFCSNVDYKAKYVEIKQPHEEIGRNCDDVIGKNGLLNWS